MNKQEALDALELYHRNMEHILGPDDEKVKIIETCIQLVEEIPESNGGGTISRQAAIDAVSRGCQEFRGIFAECEKNLNELPSAQPELIERTAYIRGFEQGRTQGMIDLQAKEVAQPNLQLTCNHLATDCISRQAAINAAKEELDNGTFYDIPSKIESLPSAQPVIRGVIDESGRIEFIEKPERKRGKWMFSSDHAEGICTICQYKIYGRPYQGNYLIVPYNFCPNCGAKMEDENE